VGAANQAFLSPHSCVATAGGSRKWNHKGEKAHIASLNCYTILFY
jgi:hypothetical protein